MKKLYIGFYFDENYSFMAAAQRGVYKSLYEEIMKSLIGRE